MKLTLIAAASTVVMLSFSAPAEDMPGITGLRFHVAAS